MKDQDWDRFISIVKAQRVYSWQRGDPQQVEMDASSFKILLIEELEKEKGNSVDNQREGNK